MFLWSVSTHLPDRGDGRHINLRKNDNSANTAEELIETLRVDTP